MTENTNVTNETTIRGPGRPVIDKVAGYKIKCGLRYAVRDKRKMVGSRAEGDVFRTEASAQKRIDQLIDSGDIKIWGGRPRAKLITVKTL